MPTRVESGATRVTAPAGYGGSRGALAKDRRRMDRSQEARKRERVAENFGKYGLRIPRIPCAVCGGQVRFSEAAIVDTLPAGGLGCGHPHGECEPYVHRVQRTY